MEISILIHHCALKQGTQHNPGVALEYTWIKKASVKCYGPHQPRVSTPPSESRWTWNRESLWTPKRLKTKAILSYTAQLTDNQKTDQSIN